MTAGIAVAVTILGAALAVAIGVRWGFDAWSVGMLVLILACGGVVVGVARRWGAPGLGPRVCPRCDGLNSPHAPNCKHCGALLPPAGASGAEPPS